MEATTAIYIVAAVMVVIGFLVVFFDRRKRGRCTEQANATVVNINRDVSRDDEGHKDYSYTPVFEFSVGGTTVRRQGGNSSSRKRKYKVGEVRPVRYNPQNPNEFCVVGEGGNISGGIWLIVLGILIAGCVLAAQLGVFNNLIK